MIVLELSEVEAQELIRDLGRTVVLLDRGSAASDDPLHRHACLHQSMRLSHFAQDLQELAVGRPRRERVGR